MVCEMDERIENMSYVKDYAKGYAMGMAEANAKGCEKSRAHAYADSYANAYARGTAIKRLIKMSASTVLFFYAHNPTIDTVPSMSKNSEHLTHTNLRYVPQETPRALHRQMGEWCVPAPAGGNGLLP